MGASWTNDKSAALKRLIESGRTIIEAAATMNRTVLSCRQGARLINRETARRAAGVLPVRALRPRNDAGELRRSRDTRHRWGGPVRFPHKTTRICLNGCGTTKVGHHQVEAGRARHWTDFWRDGERLVCDATPPCNPFVASCVQSPPTTLESS